MSPKNLSYFIDLQNFPIHEPQSSKYQQIVKEAQEALEFDGCYVLPSIVNKEAINDMRAESTCLLYTSPSPRDKRQSRMPSSA